MLALAHLEPFAIGGTRRCYVHPDEPSRCVKVLRTDRTPHVRRAESSGWRRLRGLKHFDDQYKERRAYEYLLSRHRDSIWHHVPAYYGMVETDLGIGIETRLYRDFEGSLPKNLEELIPTGVSTAVRQAIKQFKTWMRNEQLITRNLLPHNIIAVREAADQIRLVIVDGLGNSELIPISTWFGSFAQRKIERRLAFFDYRIAELS